MIWEYEDDLADIEETPLTPILADLTYKPGWRFKTFERWGRIYLQIRIEAIDADDPNQTINLRFEHSISKEHAGIMQGNRWVSWLRERIIECERHEVDEFFQLRGVKVFDPH